MNITSTSTLLFLLGAGLFFVAMAVDIGSGHKSKVPLLWGAAGAALIAVATAIRFVALVNLTGKIAIGALLITVIGAYFMGRRVR